MAGLVSSRCVGAPPAHAAESACAHFNIVCSSGAPVLPALTRHALLQRIVGWQRNLLLRLGFRQLPAATRTILHCRTWSAAEQALERCTAWN